MLTFLVDKVQGDYYEQKEKSRTLIKLNNNLKKHKNPPKHWTKYILTCDIKLNHFKEFDHFVPQQPIYFVVEVCLETSRHLLCPPTFFI